MFNVISRPVSALNPSFYSYFHLKQVIVSCFWDVGCISNDSSLDVEVHFVGGHVAHIQVLQKVIWDTAAGNVTVFWIMNQCHELGEDLINTLSYVGKQSVVLWRM